MTAKRPLSKSELDLWRRATADVKPLAEVQAELPVADPTPKSASTPATTSRKQPKARKKVAPARVKTAAGSAMKKPSRTAAALDPRGPIDIDRRNWERLKRGQVPIERKLDLHGRTQTEAHDALDRFLTMASATGLRCVLVVTGKGGVEGRGVLRRMVPRWLDETGNRDKVLTHAPAQPRHGGDGALYVLLRRRRSGSMR